MSGDRLWAFRSLRHDADIERRIVDQQADIEQTSTHISSHTRRFSVNLYPTVPSAGIENGTIYLPEFRLERLIHKRNSLLLGLQYIYEYEDGDDTALQSLIDSNIIRSEKLQLKKDLKEQELRKFEDHLVARLESLSAVADKLEPDWIRYRDTHAELDKIYSQVLLEVRQARLALLTWSRAHKLMSSGKANPAEWFSLADAPGALLKLGTKAVL